ncbi:MAG: sensor histidine kinase [Bacillota bacterium]
MFIYLYNLIAVVFCGLIVLANGYRNEYTRWIGILLLIIGVINFTYAIHFGIVPSLEGSGLLVEGLKRTLVLLSIPGVYIHFYFLACAFLVSAVYFSDFISPDFKRIASVCLGVPMLLILSVQGDFRLPIEVHMTPLRFMAHLYTILGCLLYIAAYRKNLNFPTGGRNLLYILVLLIGIISENLNYYTIQSIYIDNSGLTLTGSSFWKYNYINTTILLAGLILIGLTHGMWGVRLRIEQEKHDYSIRTLTAGTSILGHTIKNEIQKLSYIHERTMELLEQNKAEHAYDTLKDIRSVTSHLLDMTQRIKEKAHGVELKSEWINLSALIDSVVATLIPSLDKPYQIRPDVQAGFELFCDVPHIREVINNLCLNAIDATSEANGVLYIRANHSGKKLVVSFQDNGTGIERKQLDRVFEPFFTTKTKATNYGLGLSYCYNVMQKHGGVIRVAESEPGKGTIIELTFPRNRIRVWRNLVK